MVSWYIKSSALKSEQYLKTVERTVEPFMEYFIGRISEIEDYDIDKIEDLYKEIFNELPVMRLRTRKDSPLASVPGEIWLEYNRDTNIVLVDPKKAIRRKILVNNLFKNDEEI